MRMTPQEEPRITIEAQGKDAREVFAELFRQANKPFALHIALERSIYLTLRDTPFMRALQILCEVTQTRFKVEGDIYLILPRTPDSRPEPPPTPRQVKLVGRQMTLQQVVAAIEAQAGVRVEVAPETPALRFNLNLPAVEVETALDALCKETGLQWRRTERGYRIEPVPPPRLKAAEGAAASSPQSLRSPTPQPRTTPARTVPPDQPLKCPKCGYALQLEWRYCPLCGAWVKHLTDRAKRSSQ